METSEARPLPQILERLQRRFPRRLVSHLLPRSERYRICPYHPHQRLPHLRLPSLRFLPGIGRHLVRHPPPGTKAPPSLPNHLRPRRPRCRYKGFTFPANLTRGSAVAATPRTVSSDANDAERWSCNPLQWASMNAFVALCTVAGVEDYKLYAIWALRDALEDIPGERSLVGHVADLDHYVPAAAVWILCGAGEVMYREWLLLGELTGRGAAKGGALWEGGKGFELRRWRFWRERFRWVGAQTEVEIEEETREWARWAGDRMEEIERLEEAGVGGWGLAEE